MRFESQKTEKGNVRVSYVSQELADEQAKQMDANGNKNCRDCIDCRDCSGCSYCIDCSGCSGCRDCSYCRGCCYCSGCSYCGGCSYCSYCSYCSGCSDCSYCSGCIDCSYCRGCSGCSGCRDRSYCSDCSDCSDCVGKSDTLKIPKIENIDKVIYAAVTATPIALNMGRWHTCNTTHCRAGWVVHLAGDEGYALEKFFNSTALAAQLIYRESGSPINPNRFYDSNDDALADMKLRANLSGVNHDT